MKHHWAALWRGRIAFEIGIQMRPVKGCEVRPLTIAGCSALSLFFAEAIEPHDLGAALGLVGRFLFALGAVALRRLLAVRGC